METEQNAKYVAVGGGWHWCATHEIADTDFECCIKAPLWPGPSLSQGPSRIIETSHPGKPVESIKRTLELGSFFRPLEK